MTADKAMADTLLRRNLAIVSLQYELALAIGQDLQLERMLRAFLPTALKLLGARAGAVVPEGASEPVFIYPTRSRVAWPTDEAWRDCKEGILPLADGSVWQRADLPHYGWVAWWRAQPLEADIERALWPIWQRLGLACQACRQFEQTEDLRARAEAASVARAQFLANMSHEIRTPLAGVVGLLDIAWTQAENPALRTTIETARGAAQHLIDIVNDILDLSKIEAGRLELRDEVFATLAMLDEVRGAMSASAQHKGLTLTVQAAPEVPAWLRGDPVRLRQVLFNLVGNAIKFTDQGHVALSLTATRLGEGRVMTVWQVDDTGIGIEPAQLERIFEPFVQADGAYSRRHAGTGLGLAICREMVTRMGGQLTARSTVGQGSTFIVTLPLPVAEPVPAAPAARDDEAGDDAVVEPLDILVAEDHPINRRVVQALLARDGHRVTFAENGQEAVEAFRASAFDLVLMDMQMPGMDGLQATRLLRQCEAEAGRARVPIVALTANVFAEDRQRCAEAGMDGFLTKPLEMGALRHVLAEAQRAKRRRVSASATQKAAPP